MSVMQQKKNIKKGKGMGMAGKRGGRGLGNRKAEKPLLTLKRLAGYIKPYLLHFLVVTSIIILSAGLGLVPPWIIKYAVDALIMEGHPELLWLAGLGMLVIALVEGILGFGSRYAMEYMGQRIVYDIRQKVYEHLNKLSFSYFDSSKTGDLMARITSDTDTLNRFFGFASVNIITNFITLVGIFCVLIIWEYRLALLYLAMAPLMFHAMKNYAGKVRPVFQKVRRKMAGLTEIAQESIVGMEVIKLFGRDGYEADKFDSENLEYFVFMRQTQVALL